MESQDLITAFNWKDDGNDDDGCCQRLSLIRSFGVTIIAASHLVYSLHLYTSCEHCWCCHQQLCWSQISVRRMIHQMLIKKDHYLIRGETVTGVLFDAGHKLWPCFGEQDTEILLYHKLWHIKQNVLIEQWSYYRMAKLKSIESPY